MLTFTYVTVKLTSISWLFVDRCLHIRQQTLAPDDVQVSFLSRFWSSVQCDMTPVVASWLQLFLNSVSVDDRLGQLCSSWPL